MLIPNNPNSRLILVTYELNNIYKDYSSLENLLKSSQSYFKIMENVWLLYTNRNVKFWDYNMRKIVTGKDRFFISDVTNMENSGWLPQHAWDWLNRIRYKTPDEIANDKLREMGY